MDDPGPGDLANFMCRYLGCVFMGGDKGKKSLPFLQSSVVFPKFSCILENTGFGAGQLRVKPYLSCSILQGFCEPNPHGGEGSEAQGWKRTCSRSQQVWCGDRTQVF